MSNRHLSRTIALQTLYQWDFLGEPEGQLESILQHNWDEFAPGFEDGGFIRQLVNGVMEERKSIDEIIVQFAPEWPIESMTVVDRTILRLGIYEMKFAKAIPSKVAINEAIELAKSFGGDASGRFVNGVLGAVYKHMVETGTLKEIDLQPEKKAEEPPKEEKTVS